ncbi:MAG TPA: hypothetical protein VLU25_09280 [Acidobacteriota bacterium]|nr:hypothetical protein [Acidobacteriota bacterium]
MNSLRLAMGILTLLAAGHAAALLAADTFLGPDGRPLPFADEEEVLEALRTGRIISKEKVSEGINRVLKLLLDKDGVRFHAVFRDVKVFKPRHQQSDGRVIIHFRDDHIFEVAAYRLSRLLDMRHVPPVVERRIDGRQGTLQLWIEEAVMEGTRYDRRMRPRDYRNWREQWNALYIFDYLIGNDDRNQGNLLYDPGWKMWMIDHTRAFRLLSAPRRMERIRLCPTYLYEALQRLEEERLKEALEGLLQPIEVEAIARRRLEMLAYLRDLIDRKGAEIALR